MELKIGSLQLQYQDGTLSPSGLVAKIHDKIASVDNPGIWIHLLSDEELQPYLQRLNESDPANLPLYGIPFAIKDNIDLAGIPTTAGCPEFAYIPEHSAPVVGKLIAAGAIPIGKTNLDQFATGLVGTRSPYPIPRNPIAPERVPGGSSSGSAVAVSENLVSFSLGTDTAGSGRVPAAFNNIWGLKPSCGRLSTSGVVPACRTLDCVSVFALSAPDCEQILAIAEGFDARDPWSRACENRSSPSTGRIGIPRKEDVMFFGNAGYEKAWEAAVDSLKTKGWEVAEVDFSPFLEAARLLYEGPWVAERYTAFESFLNDKPEAFYPATRQIISGGNAHTAKAVFSAIYQLAACRRRSESAWESIDAIVTPTAGGFPTLADLAADPVGPNSQLGYYTNFMNLLDLCAVAAPAGFTQPGLPFGITWIAPRERDRHLLQIAGSGPTNGESSPKKEFLTLILFGAHMTGLPLNPSVMALGARFNREVGTAPVYKMVYLESPAPHRPGLVRIGAGGFAIKGEAWDFPVASIGEFISQIHQPLGIGEIELDDGSSAHGFLCEATAADQTADISTFQSWRKFLAT